MEFIRFITLFLEKYPEFKDKPFYLSGESYAGKYLPLYTHDILEDNKAGHTQLNAVGTIIGDPYSAPVLQRTQMHLVAEGLGILDDLNLDQVAALEQKCREEISINLTATASKCGEIMDYIESISGNVLPYNSRLFEYDWGPNEDAIVNIFTKSA